MNSSISVSGWNRDGWENKNVGNWDLVLCAIGSVAPVGHWTTVSDEAWAHSVHTNAVLPIKLLKRIWHRRKPNASVCFLAGANPNKAGPNYSGYYTGKMALLKAIETIDAETPDAKFFALAPGIVFTKIHTPTMESGIINQGLEDRRKVGGTPIPRIYESLQWCLAQPKEAVGGRNICVSDLDKYHKLGTALLMNKSMFKLRRVE